MPAKKYYRRGPRDKYSVEQTFFNLGLISGQTASVVVVPPSTTQGMRKVKHLTVNGVFPGEGTGGGGLSTYGIVWCLFYLPAGMNPPAFATGTGDPIVEPNQFVMNAGLWDGNAGPLRIHSPVSRNLNSGDSIVLLMLPITSSAQTTPCTGLVRYAITLN